VALAGDNGASKSTLIKAISGVFHYDQGDIYLSMASALLSPRRKETRD
jgi:ABC-type sugar transport system ATPase subunit